MWITEKKTGRRSKRTLSNQQDIQTGRQVFLEL
jgi:hypothetical protein